MERTHCQLGSRLADRLSSHNTDSLTFIDQVTTGKVTTVAHAAHTVISFTANRRADAHFINTRGFEGVNPGFVEQSAGRGYDIIAARTVDVFSHHATEHTLTQRLDNVAAFDDRLHDDASGCTTVVISDDHILRDVDQTTSQVTRVRCLQCSIGETLTSTVCRDKVLLRVQTFAEVCRDWRLDDRAIRLGHQTTHTCELTNLSCRTPRPGISHHKDRVE